MSLDNSLLEYAIIFFCIIKISKFCLVDGWENSKENAYFPVERARPELIKLFEGGKEEKHANKNTQIKQ